MELDDDNPDEDESYKRKHVETDDDTPDEDETYKQKTCGDGWWH